MRKSVSLNNVEAATTDLNNHSVSQTVFPATTCNPENVTQVQEDTGFKEDSDEPDVADQNKTTIKIRVDCYSRPDQQKEVDSDCKTEVADRKIQPAGAVIDFGSTLPRSVTRKIGSGLVPKMRLMFERARSLEPEARLSGKKRRNRFADGTESVTSFVLEESPLKSKSENRRDSTSSSSSLNSFEFEEPSTSSSFSTAATMPNNNNSLSNKKGFVNKCMSKVKNFMGSKNALQS